MWSAESPPKSLPPINYAYNLARIRASINDKDYETFLKRIKNPDIISESLTYRNVSPISIDTVKRGLGAIFTWYNNNRDAPRSPRRSASPKRSPRRSASPASSKHRSASPASSKRRSASPKRSNNESVLSYPLPRSTSPFKMEVPQEVILRFENFNESIRDTVIALKQYTNSLQESEYQLLQLQNMADEIYNLRPIMHYIKYGQFPARLNDEINTNLLQLVTAFNENSSNSVDFNNQSQQIQLLRVQSIINGLLKMFGLEEADFTIDMDTTYDEQVARNAEMELYEQSLMEQYGNQNQFFHIDEYERGNQQRIEEMNRIERETRERLAAIQPLSTSPPRQRLPLAKAPLRSPRNSARSKSPPQNSARSNKYTIQELRKMKVAELRTLCESNGLDIGGKKDELIQKLKKWLKL